MNPGALIRALRKVLGGHYKANRYHDAIATMNVETIWTTNFDVLIEDALRQRERVVVRTCDADLTAGSLQFSREVLKMHGCIQRSGPDEFVMTTQDYEDYAADRSVFAQRLRHDLSHRRFLFAGYGFNDPNIRTAAAEIRRLSGNAPRHHFMIARIKPGEDPEVRRRTELWLEDLRRIGIDSAVVAEYSEIEEAFEAISVRSRGRSVFVTGGHRSKRLAEAETLGRRLATTKEPIRLLDGQSEGIGRAAASAFGAAILQAKKDLRERVRYFVNPYAVNPGMSNNPSLLPTLKAYRASLFRAAHTVVVFDGGMGTEAEVEVARSMRCTIIPVFGVRSGLAARLLQDPRIKEGLNKLDRSYARRALAGRAKVDDVVALVEKSFA